MYCVYVLLSLKDKKFYTGFSQNIRNRLKEHDEGKVISTRNRRPLRLIYYEWCLNEKDAIRREKYLKTSYGKRHIKNRVKNYLDSEVNI